MKILKVLLAIPVSLVAIAIGLALSLVVWPQILVNPFVIGMVAQWASNQGVDVRWDRFHIKIDSISLLRKRFQFSASNLCVHVPENEIKGCGKTFDFTLALNFSSLPPKITELGPLDLNQLHWKVGKGKKTIRGVANLETGKEVGSELQNWDQWISRVFRISGNANFPDHSRLELSAHFNINRKSIGQKLLKSLELKYFVDATYSKGDAQVLAQLQGSGSPDQWEGKISAVADEWIEGFPGASLKNCSWSLKRKRQLKAAQSFGEFQLNCPLWVRTPDHLSLLDSFDLPEQWGATVEAHLNTDSFPPLPDSRVKGPIEIKINPVLSRYFEAGGEVKAQIDAIPSQPPQKWKTNATLNLKLLVPQFEMLVARLEKTPWAIPAPLNVLQGRIGLDVKGGSNIQAGEFPFDLKTRLRSKTQVLDINGQGGFKYHLKPKGVISQLDLNVSLSDVQLELPRLDWAAPPPLVSDRRFVHSSHGKSQESDLDEEAEESSFNYQVAIQTSANRPVRILSNLAQEKIPVHLNLKLASSVPILGDLSLDPFPVEFLRRRANVERLQLHLANPIESSPLNGTVRIDYADYVMKINLLSTIGKPVIKLSSEPVLPENQLVAALIFGRPLEELDSDQSASVGNTRAALTDGAIGLLSFYALASTPIQSVGYDSLTGIVSAKVRLGDGTSLNLGKSADTSVIGIRKRLSRSWTIETDVSDSALWGQVASAYLEWSHRY